MILIILNSIIILGILALMMIGHRKHANHFSTLNNKEHSLKLFYPTSQFLMITLEGKRKFIKQEKLATQFEILYPKDAAYHLKLHRLKKFSMVLFLVLVFSVLSLFISLASMNTLPLPLIQRPKANEASKEIQAIASAKVEGENFTKSYTVIVDPIEYLPSEINQVLNLSIQYIHQHVLGQNENKDHVRNHLYFPNSIPDYPVEIAYETNPVGVIDKSGKIDFAQVDDEGSVVNITARVSYKEHTMETDFGVRVLPSLVSGIDVFDGRVSHALIKANQEDGTHQMIRLPEEVDGAKIQWKIKEDHKAYEVYMLGLIMIVVVYFMLDKEVEQKIKIRNQQFTKDYPELVSKLSLLVGAGMTVSKAFERLAVENNKATVYNVYTEVSVMVHEIQAGISEMQAVGKFGKRCNLSKYRKLSSLLTQNMQRGSSDLMSALENETREAFEQRKEHAKRLGEEASTKLLVPMMMMLLIVLIIVMAPAMMSMF